MGPQIPPDGLGIDLYKEPFNRTPHSPDTPLLSGAESLGDPQPHRSRAGLRSLPGSPKRLLIIIHIYIYVYALYIYVYMYMLYIYMYT